MTKQVRVNVCTAINSAGIKRERRHGRDYMIVPSATMPDNIVMNRVRYPADQIAKAYGSLENTPAPLGHPSIEGAFVSASDPEGLARGWIGAWNRNVRRENGRVFVDKVIDIATAQQLEGGKMVLDAIEKGEPVHTSTGLYAILTAVENDDAVDWEASDIVFDHDAILIGEDGAANPSQGVGMMVNAAKNSEGEQIEVINSKLEDWVEQELDWAADSALRAVERLERVPLLERIKDAIKGAVQGALAPEAQFNQEETSMDKAQFDELSGKVEALSNAVTGLDDKIASAIGAALKPVIDAQEAITNAAKAKEEADKAALVNKVVEARLLDEETAKAADIAVLNALVERAAEAAKPGHATLLNGAFKSSGDKPDFKLPEGE